MSPERNRAHERVRAIRLDHPSEVVGHLLDLFELLEIARDVVAAKSGQQRAAAFERLFAHVEKLEKVGE